MPFAAQFALDATIVAQKADLLDLTSGDTLDVVVNVYGFDPADTQVQWVFTAKVNPSDADSAPTTVQKIITPSEVTPSGIRAVSLSPTSWQGHFLLSQTDTAKLVGCTSYDVRVFITRASASYDRTVLRGSLSAAAGATGIAVLFSGNAAYTTGTRSLAATGTFGPLSPVTFKPVFDAAGIGTTGATRRFHYVKGTARQTILANGNAGLPSPGTNSSTGFWLTKWDDEIIPGAGNHFRPTATINGGNGAECLADGTLVGEGLELPATVMDGLLALAHHDHGSKAGAVSPDVDTTIVGSDGLYQVLVDRSAGVTIGGIWKLRAGTLLVSYGEAGDPNRVIVDSDEIGNWEALRQVPALFGAWASFGVGTQILPSSKWFVTAAANLPSNFSISRFDRDLIHDDVNGIYVNRSGDPMATGRRLRLLVNDGNVANADTAVSEFYLDTGRANAAQQKLMCDWAAGRYAVWTDTRTRAAFWFGDSFQSPYQSRDIVANVTTGAHSLPPLADCAMTVFARSGNNVSDYQFPFLYFMQDCDFSARAKVAVMWGEWLNDSAGETAAQQLVRNYYGLDFVRAINAKIKACIMNLAWCRDDTGRPTNDPAIENDLNANAVSSHGAQFVLNMLHNQFYNTYNYGGGTPATQVDLLWNGADSHPSGQGLDYQDAFYQYAFLRLLGDDVSNKTVSVDPSVDHVSLSAGTPTATPTWTAHLADLITPATGKTISFAMMKMIGGVPTPDTSVATVNASTGLITRVAPGTAYVLATSNDGAEGVCGVVCT